MAKCKFCTEARESLDTKMEAAFASIDTSIVALDALQTSMNKVKWGRRKNPDRANQGPEQRSEKPTT